MSGCQPRFARSVLAIALAVYFLIFASFASSLHTCDPQAQGELSWERACLACLFSAELRVLSLPADVETAVLAQAERIPLPPDSILAVSQIWDVPLPRAPPPHSPS
jgi:hypothetical protein